MIRIQEIKPEQTYAIRKSVLRDGMSLSHEMAGDHDIDSLHLGIFDKDELVCIGSFMKASKPYFKGEQYQLRGMASARGFQGKGYGKVLMSKAEDLLKEKGVNVLWCNARQIATGFYEKLGYKIKGSKFDVPEVGPHYVMYKKLC